LNSEDGWMRRRHIAIGFGVAVIAVALALGVMLMRAKPGRFEVRMLGYTNDGPVSYVVLVTNGTHRPHGFTAWSEYSSDGLNWRYVEPYKHGTVVQPGKSETFTLLRSSTGHWRRIRVSCFPLNTKSWQHWRDSLKALAGMPWSQSYRVYIAVE
jgi:hypothetical protein